MSKRDELIKKYSSDIKEKIGEETDLELLIKVTISLGASIYNADASIVSATDKYELLIIKQNFLIKKLGLSENLDLDSAIATILEKYGKSNQNKYRAVVYYMLTKYFHKEDIYFKKGTGPR